MASFVSKNCKAWVNQYALHGRLNAITLNEDTETKDETVFGNDTRINKPGLSIIAASYAGLFESDGTSKIDDAIHAVRGAQNSVISLAPTTGAVGERCFTFRAAQSEIRREGQIGELAKINASAVGSSGEPCVPGLVLFSGTASETGDGTVVQVGAATSTQKLYAALHVLSKSGTSPTLDVELFSAAAGGFASPTSRITFSQATTEGVQWATPVSGAITNTYYRVTHTIGGTGSPSFDYVLVVGII